MVLLGACAAPSSTSPSSEVADELRVGLTEFDITSSATVLVEGTVTMEVTNAGATAHDLRIAATAVDEHVALLDPGESASLSLDTNGEQELRLWCSVPGHRANGMQRTLQVDGGTASTMVGNDG